MEDKRTIAKNTLSFSCSKTMEYLRTPKDIWEKLSKEFDFTLDACASDDNHLVDKYYTKDNSALDHSWDNEVAYIHPLFDSKIGKFVEKASKHKGTFVFLLPASTHTRYFHQYFYKKDNVEIRFLEKPNRGFRFGKDDGSEETEEEMKKSIGYIKPLMICVMKNK
jgi:site-specific DNA-methyltransferase (adenine-specific)